MKKLLPLLFLLAFTTTNAQTFTLTKGANEPIAGDTSKTYIIDTSAYVSGLNVSLTGSNTVWTYTNLVCTPNSGTSSYTTPAAVPSSSSYPGCTIVQKQGTLYSFYKSVSTPSTQLEFLGVSSPSLTMNFTNTALFMQYPFAFGNTFTDSFSGSFTFSVNGQASGNATVTADGTGTLNLPDGIILNNVIRIKSVQATNFTFFGSPVGNLKQTTYAFYHSSQKFPILTIDYSALTTGTTTTLTSVVTGNKNDFTVGLNENTLHTFPAVLYPNPANNVLNIQLNSSVKPKEIMICDQLGQTVYASKFQDKIEISSLNPGIYFIEIKTEQGIARKKFIKD